MDHEAWPDLPYEPWSATRDTLHMWTQVVGKLKLALCPFLNQWWEVTFVLTARGLSTGLVPYGDRSFDVELDFVAHRLVIRVSDGARAEVALARRSVADFHAAFVGALREVGIDAAFSDGPSEVADPIPFAQDTTHASYDAASVERWWRVMVSLERVITRYRTPFHGKSSPVQFFWGGMDLSHTRFTGRALPPPAGGPIMEFGEDEENFAVGFWPGSADFPHAVLYAYMTPAPVGIADAAVAPAAARWEPALGELVLHYDEVARAADPDAVAATFFRSAYEASAALAGWDRSALEGHVPTL